jgi:ubiquinone/menaquinone biosynthesis C-methylase UbiE
MPVPGEPPVSTPHKVEIGYDSIAEQYLAQKHVDDLMTLTALEEMMHGLPKRASVLDLGCGAGVPVTQWLAQQCEVTGVDVSARQLSLARRHVPAATFIKADMSELDVPAGSFDAVVAFYSIIHVPRIEQPALLNRIYGWLRPGGSFLATWAINEWEGEEENWEGWGAPMWWSHYDARTNLSLIRGAGFRIHSAETRVRGDETWLWVLARK